MIIACHPNLLLLLMLCIVDVPLGNKVFHSVRTNDEPLRDRPIFLQSIMPTTSEWLKNWQSASGGDREALLAYLATNDGIFAESIAKGLLLHAKPVEMDAEHCGLLQVMSKYPTPNCRRLLVSMIPALLSESWRLGWFEKDPDSPILQMIDQTLLMCYEQDLKVRPSPSIRICPPSRASIYSSAIKTSSTEFPFSLRETRIDPPSFNQRIKEINDYSRLVVTARLCQTIQDVFTELSPHTRQAYTDLLLQLTDSDNRRTVPADDDVCLLWLKATYFVEPQTKGKLLKGIAVMARNALLPKTILALQQ